jgi:N-acetyl-alpha-D-muramate 1-phosphate uridylyltransferase
MGSPTRAMIMAAGLGTRMRPLTDDRPKPLVEVAGKALIDHAIDRLKAAGVNEFVVNLHYKAQMIREHLARRRGLSIHFSDESDGLLGTGGGVAKALHFFGEEPFFIHNSDTIWVEGYGQALEQMKAAWDPEVMDGLLLMAPMISSIGYEGVGDFMMDPAGHLSRVPPGRVSPFAFPGVQIVHPRLFANPPPGGFSTNLMWDRAIEKERLYGIRLDGIWIHVGTPQAVAQAGAYLADLAPAA